jgi:hypothetical protein
LYGCDVYGYVLFEGECEGEGVCVYWRECAGGY